MIPFGIGRFFFLQYIKKNVHIIKEVRKRKPDKIMGGTPTKKRTVITAILFLMMPLPYFRCKSLPKTRRKKKR